jgi:hypothetical protein
MFMACYHINNTIQLSHEKTSVYLYFLSVFYLNYFQRSISADSLFMAYSTLPAPPSFKYLH